MRKLDTRYEQAYFGSEAVLLPSGKIWRPIKGQEPEYPCIGCKLWEECRKSCDFLCEEYDDYEAKVYVYRGTCFGYGIRPGTGYAEDWKEV